MGESRILTTIFEIELGLNKEKIWNKIQHKMDVL